MARYWVGTTGNWSDTANWSDTSGGAGGFSVPTLSDDVYFDANSGSGVVTVDVASECDDLIFTGFVGTFAGSAALGIYGSLTMAAGMTRTYTGAITFRATTTGKTLTFAGQTTSSTVTFNGAGGGWTLQDAWNNGVSASIIVSAGLFDTNDFTLTAGSFASQSTSTRTVDLGASTVNLTFNWLTATTTNLTFIAGTSTINLSANGTINFQGGGLTYNAVTLTHTSSASSYAITGANTFGSLTITGNNIKTETVSLSANQTVTGTLTIAGNSATNRLLIQSNTLGTARAITAAATTLSNVDFQDITGAGAGSWSGTSIGNALGNSGITFTTPVLRYAVASGNWSSTGMWSATSGGASGASVPLCHDTVYLNASSAAGTYTADMPRLGADIDCTGFTRTLTTSTAASIFGSLTLSSGMTISGTNLISFYGRSSHTLDFANKSLSTRSIEIRAFGGTYTLQSGFSTSDTLFVYFGTFDFNDQSPSIGTFQASLISSVAPTVNLGTGTILVTNASNCWSVTSANINAETSVIEFNNSSSVNKNFIGGSRTYNTLRFTGAGTGSYTISGSNTFNTIESTKTNPHSILFSTGTTQTITNWNVTGSAGNLVTINSTTTGTHNLVKAGGGEVRSDYLNIQHSVATPANTWYAGVNSTNNQSTPTAGSGWLFTVPLPTVTTQAVTSITDATAVGNGNVTDDGSGIISLRGFVVSTTSRALPGNIAPASTDYELAFTDSGTFAEGAYTKTLTGLTQLTTYYVRSVTQNQAGYSYGAEVSFTTDETPAVAALTTEAVTVIGSTTATGNGTTVDANGTVTRRGFAVSTSSHSNPSNTDPDVSDYELVFDESGTFGNESFDLALTALSDTTLYYVRAFNENAVGFSYGDEVSFTTDSLPAVSITGVSNRQSEEVTLNGNVTDDGGDTITARGFVYDTVTRSLPGNVAPGSTTYASNTVDSGSYGEGVYARTITGLAPNTTYYGRAFAQNSLGYVYSDELVFTTQRFPNSQILTQRITTTALLNNIENNITPTIINKADGSSWSKTTDTWESTKTWADYSNRATLTNL